MVPVAANTDRIRNRGSEDPYSAHGSGSNQMVRLRSTARTLNSLVQDMAEAFGSEIPKLLVSGDTLDVVKQSAALCLLRLFRTDPSVIPSGKRRGDGGGGLCDRRAAEMYT